MTHIIKFIQTQLRNAADDQKAAPMQDYMKTSQPFYGVQTTERKAIFREARRLHPIECFNELRRIIHILWHGTYREEMYVALDIGEHYHKFNTPDAFSFWEEVLATATNWDTVDWIASRIMGLMVLNHPQLSAELPRLSKSPNMWIRRTSLLVHLKHKDHTDFRLLEKTILKLAHEKEFFIRKAIGWVLREYSKTNPAWVLSFVQSHPEKLSVLSQREALKIIRKNRDSII
jgi:3-methyladenine DNA glycosylase AlkD